MPAALAAVGVAAAVASTAYTIKSGEDAKAAAKAATKKALGQQQAGIQAALTAEQKKKKQEKNAAARLFQQLQNITQQGALVDREEADQAKSNQLFGIGALVLGLLALLLFWKK